MQSPQYAPNDSTRVGADRSVGRGRVLSQSLLVARERRRRELGSNLVIDTIALTSGEGHVVEVGISRRVRKILAGVPASVSIRDHILALSSSRSKRQYWTVGNRPIRNNDLRSLHRNPVEAQIQDRSRQKTGLNTAPAFSRVYNKPPLRGAKGTRAQHAGDARNSPPLRHSREPSVIPADAGTQKKQSTPPNLPFAKRRGRVRSTQGMPENHQLRPPRSSEHQDNPSIIPPPLHHPPTPSVIPASHPSFPRTTPSFPRTREPSKNKAHRLTSPSRSEGDACAARRGCPKTTNTPPSKLRTPRQPLHHPPTPSVIPASLTSFPQALRHSRKPYVIPADAGTQRKTKHAISTQTHTPTINATTVAHPSVTPTPNHHTPPIIPPRHSRKPLRHSRKPLRHSRGRGNPEKNKARQSPLPPSFPS